MGLVKQNNINNIQFYSVAVQIFTANGTYTPTVGMKYCIVECIGGGGASGGSLATGASEVSCAGGGAGGGYIQVLFTAAQIGASRPIVIGTGGNGVSGATGGSGGNTTFGGTLAVANGGNGGNISTATTTSDLAGPVSGGNISNSSGTLLFGFQGERGEGSFCSRVSGHQLYTGKGGGSFYGRGGPAFYDDSEQGSVQGVGYGSGPRGNSNIENGSVNTGADGTNGICIILEFI